MAQRPRHRRPSAGLGQPADYSNYLRGQMPKLSFPRGTHGNSSPKKVELVMARWHRDHVIDAPSAGLGQPADYSNYLRGQMPKLRLKNLSLSLSLSLPPPLSDNQPLPPCRTHHMREAGTAQSVSSAAADGEKPRSSQLRLLFGLPAQGGIGGGSLQPQVVLQAPLALKVRAVWHSPSPEKGLDAALDIGGELACEHRVQDVRLCSARVENLVV